MTACCLLTRVNFKNASAVCRRPNFPEYDGMTEVVKQSKFIHIARGFLVVTRTIASYRAHLIVRLAVLASFICRVLRGKSRYVFCSRTDEISYTGCRSLSFHTFDLGFITLGFPHHQRSGFAVQGIRGIGIPKQLRQEHFKYVDHFVHG